MDVLILIGWWVLKIYGGIAAIVFIIFLFQDIKETILLYRDLFVTHEGRDYIVPFMWFDIDLYGKKHKKLIYWCATTPGAIIFSVVLGLIWPYVLFVIIREVLDSLHA